MAPAVRLQIASTNMPADLGRRAVLAAMVGPCPAALAWIARHDAPGGNRLLLGVEVVANVAVGGINAAGRQFSTRLRGDRTMRLLRAEAANRLVGIAATGEGAVNGGVPDAEVDGDLRHRQLVVAVKPDGLLIVHDFCRHQPR